MCKTKFLQMCLFSIIFTSPHSLNLSFLLLFYLLYLSFRLDSVHHHPDFLHFSHFHADSRQILSENRYFSSKTNTPFCYYCITLGTESLLTSSETSSGILPKKNYLKVPKTYNLWSISNNWVDEVLLKIYVKEKHNLPEIINFFVICVNFKKNCTTNFVQRQFWWIVDCRFNGIRHIFISNFVLVVYGVNGVSVLYCLGIKMQKKKLLPL